MAGSSRQLQVATYDLDLVLAGHGMSLFKADGAVDARLTKKGGDDEGEHICGQAGGMPRTRGFFTGADSMGAQVLVSGTGCRARAADDTHGGPATHSRAVSA
jgi:hypothetical protein